MTNIFENKKCTWYQAGITKKGNKIIPLVDILTSPDYTKIDLVKQIRSYPYGSDKQKELKLLLTAATFSSVQSKDERSQEHHIEHSGFIQFDIDPKENPSLLEVGGIEQMKKILINIPYTAYCGLSASGLGIWGLFAISDPLKHNPHFKAMESSFSSIGITIDPAPSNVASLRFISYDESSYLNKTAKVFTKIYEEFKPNRKPIVTPNNNNELGGKELIEKFNSEVDFDLMNDILLNAGWQYHSTSGVKVRYTRPDKSIKAGISADYHTEKRTFTTFSSASPGLSFFKQIGNVWSASPVTLLLNYECGGQWNKAFNIMKTLS